jgi:hypothetical protein
MMSLTTLEQQLSLLEAQFNAVSNALIAPDPVDVQTSSAQLQQLAVEFLQMRDDCGRNSLNTPHLVLRLQALAQGMPMVRENLLRRSAYVERALALLVPQAQAQSTYSDSSGPYASGVRASGQFKAFSA